MYIHLYIYTFIYLHTYIHIPTYIYIYIRQFVRYMHMYVYMYIFIFIFMHTHNFSVSMHVYIHTCIYSYLCVHVFTRVSLMPQVTRRARLRSGKYELANVSGYFVFKIKKILVCFSRHTCTYNLIHKCSYMDANGNRAFIHMYTYICTYIFILLYVCI